MRNRIEETLQQEEVARKRRASISRVEKPGDWADADAEWMSLRGELSSVGREAVRSLGLARELTRALRNTGFAVRNIGMQLEPVAMIVVELQGEPETPAEHRRAADPTVADSVRQTLDEFHSRTGIEVNFPFDKLGD